ncbi:hypothetical protein [Rhodoplanes sp. Z2-YC6860]|uniref:hypothetical protein n=1 Tax=Rhodoplanes sp. Z2-YC6860 TaxID=674703 RepID=UPI00078B2D52|nr:hypothetical protein [Rhodoplanes sp. Z2-YC6860]AMN43774.1 hypothetical protein RHPLAN_53580 [Rhodoplanes sp. Z2-YC6860]
MRLAALAGILSGVLFGLLLGLQPSLAGDCIISGPAPRLDSQSIEWTMGIGRGQQCIRGLRSAAMLINRVEIESPAKHGQVKVQGYAFSYEAPTGFTGEDFFSVLLDGSFRGVPGHTLIKVQVNIR